jgi:hypothetical protein
VLQPTRALEDQGGQLPIVKKSPVAKCRKLMPPP